MNSSRQALLALHGAVVLFGGAGLIGRLVAAPPLVVTCVRSLVGALVLAAVAGLTLPGRTAPAGAAAERPRRLLAALLATGALLAAHWWSFFTAVQLGSVTLGLLTFASYPLFAVALEPLVFGERWQVCDFGACLGVLAGLALVVPEWDFGTQAGLAAVCGLGAGFTFAVLSLVNRRLLRWWPARRLVAAQTGVAGLLLLPLAAPHLAAVSARDWTWLVLLGAVFTGLAHWAFTAALSRVPVRVAGVTAALEPVYGVALAWWILGEPLGGRVLAGGALLVTAAVLAAGSRAGPNPPARERETG